MSNLRKLGSVEKKVLHHIAFNRGVTHKDLMTELNQDRGNLSRRLDKLENSGYIEVVGEEIYKQGEPGKKWGITLFGFAFMFPDVLDKIDIFAQKNETLLPLIFKNWTQIKEYDIHGVKLADFVLLFLWVALQKNAHDAYRIREDRGLDKIRDRYGAAAGYFDYLLSQIDSNGERFDDARILDLEEKIYRSIFFGLGFQEKNIHDQMMLDALWEIASHDDRLQHYFRKEITRLEKLVREDVEYVKSLKMNLVHRQESEKR